MAFVACTTGTVALYSVEGNDEQLLAIPVEAWGETGAAYIASVMGLILAETRPGFVRLEQTSQRIPLPGQPAKQPVRVGPPPAKPRGPRDPAIEPPRGGGR